ncbi:hypothetical protein HRI_002332300 [Hibiscus trionum]|uniref:Histone deacetylase domain-containing protein n=1 Tax=Hibiscus trionum TaxID=183268 RepID=A0A9W7M5P0_HIBTR|nr:hypothetical protein HRI_002332300 [Hibiscus trionum]
MFQFLFFNQQTIDNNIYWLQKERAAGKLAKEQGLAINVGGGFHHCSGGRGCGFSAYIDISLCIHFAFVRSNISRVMIIDLDAHQGNGHESKPK